MHRISRQRRCQGDGHCCRRRAGLGRGDGHGVGRRSPRHRQPHTAGTLPAAAAGEEKLPQGRMAAGSRAPTKVARGWRGLVPRVTFLGVCRTAAPASLHSPCVSLWAGGLLVPSSKPLWTCPFCLPAPVLLDRDAAAPLLWLQPWPAGPGKKWKKPTKCSLCPSPCPLSGCCKFSLVFCNLMIYSQEKISLQFTKKSLLI